MALGAGADTIVRFAGVRKTYDGRHLVVRDLDLEIRRGEFLTLLGPSGSGKTTTLMMLAGFEVPTDGDILVEGRPVTDVPPHRRNIGMVFQSYALFPHMTVAQNLAFPLEVRRVPKAEIRERVAQALAMVRLGSLGDRRPAQLSGGQQQRVALARALVFGPSLVLMDEPLGALDKQLREHMQIEIKHIHESTGLTVVYVTHDQGEALTMSDRVAVFEDGVIQQIDTPSRLYEEPANGFVAGFLGENNLIPATVEATGGEHCTLLLDGGARVEARSTPAAVPGARVVLSVRPERATVRMDGAGNGLPATFVEAIYHGDHSRMILEVAGNPEFTVKLPLGFPLDGIEPGRALRVEFPRDHCRALAPPGR